MHTDLSGDHQRSANSRRNTAGFVLWLLALNSCINSTGGRDDQERISGLYVLEQVNGQRIPATLPTQQGCGRTARNGILTISAAGPDVQPMYDWGVQFDTDCDPAPSGVLRGIDDVGTWHYRSAQLSFNSLMGRGSYSAALQEVSGNPPAVTVVYQGDSYRYVRLMRWDDSQGVVFVRVVDQSGQPVAGVQLIFTFANGIQGGGTTPASGEFGTGGVVGECKIAITPGAGYEVAATQPNPVSVQVVEGPPLRIQVFLTKVK